MVKYFFTGLGLLLFSVFSTHVNGQDIDAWADSVLATMSVKEKIGQLLYMAISPADDPAYVPSLKQSVDVIRPGGLFLTGGNVSSDLLEMVKKAKGVPLIVGGTSDQSEYVFTNNQMLSSVTDHKALQYVRYQFTRGLENNGMDYYTGGKAYDYPRVFGTMDAPRLWDDQAVQPVFATREYEEINSLQQYMAIITPLDSVVFIGKEHNLEYTVSSMLRKTGYNGAIITDLTKTSGDFGKTHPAVLAFFSGTDIIMTNGGFSGAISAIEKAIKKQKSDYSYLDEKCRRALRWKRFVLNQKRGPKETSIISEGEFQDRLMRSSVTIHKNDNDLLPLKNLDNMTVAVGSFGPVPEGFKSHMSKYSNVHFAGDLLKDLEELSRLKYYTPVFIPLTAPPDKYQMAILQDLRSHTRVGVVLFYNPESLDQFRDFDVVVSAHIDSPVMQGIVPQILYGALPALGRTTKHVIPGLSQGITYQPVNRLQYGVGPEYAGMSTKTLDKIDEVVREAIEEGATPGCQVLVVREGKVVFDRNYGHFTYEKKKPVTEGSIYDLASLTKVLATLQAIMFLHDRNLIDINKRLSNYLPELKGSNKEDLVIKDILLHQAGLRPYMPFWVATMDQENFLPQYYSPYQEEEFPMQISNGLYATPALRDSIWSWIIGSRLLKKKRSEPYKYRYSDMGFYMLQRLAEEVLNQPLDEFLNQNFYDPLGMTTTGYLPLCRYPVERIPPTAIDEHFRKVLVSGLVHDEGAAMFGGVAGHAGLFSNANDLAKLAHMLLSGGQYGGERYFSESTVEQFAAKQEEESHRGLGWNRPIPGSSRSPVSSFASERTFGHTGFTGTAVWIDPEFGLIYIFLSNRIHPNAENTRLMSANIRGRIQDIIYQSIWDFEQYAEDGGTRGD